MSKPGPYERKTMLYDLEVREHLKEALEISESDLRAEFCRLPGDVAYWNARAADAGEVQAEAEAERKDLEAELSDEIRTRLELTYEEALDAVALQEHKTETEKKAALRKIRKPTEAAIDAAIRKDERYREALRKERVADAEKNRARGYAQAVAMKKDMLMALGRHVSDESRALGPTVND